ncbi:MAG: hypothetical protein JRJ03_17485 [Deltaproteobacteria bacterium]|nr:hypothetical protein [Deltaproteobacteria bacterium]
MSFNVFMLIQKLHKLEEHYRSQTKVAKELGISYRHYQRIRKACHATKSMEMLIDYKLQEIEFQKAACQ